MSTPHASARPQGGFAALAALGMALRLLLIWSGWLDPLLPTDDAYYYFTIARNAITGGGVSFDRLTPTNGFHPLWMVVVTPLFAVAEALKPGPWFGVRAALTLCALLDLATAKLLHATLMRLGRPIGARWAVALWFLFPTHIMLSLQGLEGAISATVIALHAWFVVRLAGRPGITVGSAVPLGAIAGLAFLARTDNGVFVPLAIVAETALLAWSGRLAWRRAPAFLLVCAATMSLVASPWLAWNIVTFGTPFQVSGAIKMSSPLLGGHVEAAIAVYHLPKIAVQVLALGQFLWRPIQFALGGYLGTPWPAVMGLAALEAVALALLLVAGVRRMRHEEPPAARTIAAGLGVYLAAHMLVYTFVVPFYAHWYASVPALVLLLVFVGLGADSLLGGGPAQRRRALVAIPAAIGLAMWWRFFSVMGIHPNQPQENARAALAQIAERAPRVSTLGCFHGQTGAWGYFAPSIAPYRIVNLDGVVNNRVLESYRRGKYFEYVSDTADLVVLTAPVPFEYLLGPAGTRRFYATFKHWEDAPNNYGPRRSPPPR
jgi:hypothetical protein